MRTLLLIGALAAASPSVHAQHRDLVETARRAGSFQTLLAAADAAGLVGALQGDGPLTVFAPTDAAFAALPEGTVASLLEPENRGTLAAILTYHVVPGRLAASDVLGRRSVDTLNGQRAAIAMQGDALTIAGAPISATDVLATNGVIHVIDAVMMPSTQNLAELAQGAGTFQTLIAAAKAAGLVDALVGEGPLTVFAPTDDAFAQLGRDAIQDLLRPRNRARLASILKFHVVPGRVFADQALVAGNAASLEGSPLRFALERGRLTVGGTSIIANDLQATNGVVHVVDAVLLPPEPAPAGRLVVGFYHESPSAALAAQLGIDDRHAAMVVTDVTVEGNGLAKFDVITAVDGKPCTQRNFDAAKEAAGAGGTLTLTTFRGGQERHLEVRVGVCTH